MERPALKRLLADISAGRIDTVVVYKIDRLTRSLADFARIVELFDANEASFVSVTQAFNTTSSMGRLTLNVLLSFAQFEREVTGERIRDKIAASKAKGMWMGGTLPLGYDLPVTNSRALVVNDAEAESVRMIFTRYLALGSVHALERELARGGMMSKRNLARNGSVRGGVPFSRGALFHLLRNRTYLGQIAHGEIVHPGLHEPIVDTDLFEAVQARLDAQKLRSAARPNASSRAPLTGRLFDAQGQPMTPTFSRGARGRTYRYYVATALQQGQRRSQDDGAIARLSAPAFEALVAELLRRLTDAEDPLALPGRVIVHEAALHILLPVRFLPKVRGRLAEGEQAERDPDDPQQMRLEVLTTLCLRGGRTTIAASSAAPVRRDPVLIAALRRAHAMVDVDRRGMPLIASAPASPYLRRLVRLAFLAPDLQRAILDGRQPLALTLERLMYSEIPLSWSDQKALIA